MMTWRNLPVGSNPKALDFPHFPTRQQAVIWRNWELAPVERLAKVLRTNSANVLALARGMGLRVPPVVEKKWLERGYCTLIRANWHLLPYEQLLELLDWPAERLAFALREEDALWIKLGALKPKVATVRYAPLTRQQAEKTAELKAMIEKHFPNMQGKATGERSFAFLDGFRSAGGPVPKRIKRNDFDLRFIYSYSAPYGDCLLHPELDPYPDGLLENLAAMGVNGVWLPALLYTLVPWNADPALSAGHEIRLGNLRRLAERVAKKGLGLFLYLNEPRALPFTTTVFKKHPEWGGIRYEQFQAISLCTSNPEVLDFVREGTTRLFREAPQLAGVFTITMSEFPTNCYSKGRGQECPRCSKRPPQEVVAEVNRAIAEGAHGVKRDARVIVWTWAWAPEWEKAVVDLLPKNVELMCVSEWGLPLKTYGGGKPCVVDYSISRVGPSQRSLDLWKHALRRGMKAVAKVQLNNSWELSAVPYLPVVDLVEEHLQNLRQAGVSGLMLSWTVGGYPDGNLGLVDKSSPELAEEKFGRKAAPLIRAAWRCFSEAFREFPFSCPVIYCAPHNAGPMNLLHAKPTGFTATMVQGFPYDDLRVWRDFYPEAVFEEQFRKLSEGWRTGFARLEKASTLIGQNKLANFLDLERVARAAYCHFRSAYLQIAFVRKRGNSSATARRILREILDEEIALARTLHDLVRTDSRIGFEAANHYSYTVNDLQEKVLNCEFLKKRYYSEPAPAKLVLAEAGSGGSGLKGLNLKTGNR
ncbi:MAG: hypothetical protein HY360_25205 [Verrucomicrobia bacterium]|nr:hypothetical protein [Verrucomicrobiota bacterium]